LPEGFRIDLYATDVVDARSMTLGDDGTLFVGSRRAGTVLALRDDDGDGVAERRWLIADGLRMPNGVAFGNGALYVAENHRLIRFDQIERRLSNPPAPVVLTHLPERDHHGWRFLRFGPDGRLYLSIGAPCNVCDQQGFGLIMRLEPDGSGQQVVARGVRNSVGFDWEPATGNLWFTDNGRDWLGDDLPSDELNRVTATGQHFGFPFCHDGDLPDPEYGQQRRCSDFIAPALALGAHVAPLGMRFYQGTKFPTAYRGALFIAEHGSWNRSEPVGYRVVVVQIIGGKVIGQHIFAEGWLDDSGNVSGRPVDLQELPDGSLLLSDDKSGVIYRISYTR
jgi:glucose/arabinose dehydrogenase